MRVRETLYTRVIVCIHHVTKPCVKHWVQRHILNHLWLLLGWYTRYRTKIIDWRQVNNLLDPATGDATECKQLFLPMEG